MRISGVGQFGETFCFDCAKHGRYFSSLLMGVSFELVWSGGMSEKSKGERGKIPRSGGRCFGFRSTPEFHGY